MDSFHPTKKEFLRLARKANLIPVYREILADTETPVSAFLKIGGQPYSYLLESVEGGSTIARYSFLGGTPSLVFKSKGRRITFLTNGGKESFVTKTDPLRELEKVLGRYRQAPVRGLAPFSGGAVGYLGYDMVRFIEKIPDKNPDTQDIPDSLFIFTDTLFAFDHLSKKIQVICNAHLPNFKDADEAYEHAVQKINGQVQRLRQTRLRRGRAEVSTPESGRNGSLKFISNFKKAAFEKAVRAAKRHIRKGDIIQVVLSQAFRVGVDRDPFNIYRALRSINPSPYLFYLDGGGFQLVGSSPEIHVRCQGATAVLRPIAGTRRRGRNEREDRRLEKELLADPKERAEHLMLVDLGRNDLGRVCEFKSIRVPEFMTLERYSHVMHIVSRVEGRLRRDRTVFDLLRATFPAGTISGAPKVRAMEIIDELENQKRGFYSGIVGYFSYSGNLDSCITIRTLLVKGHTATVQAGAGVVADSNPTCEYQETVNKAAALFKAVEAAERGVSL